MAAEASDRRAPPPPGHPAASGPRRPRRRAQVRPAGRARHPRARQRAGDRRARRGRRAGRGGCSRSSASRSVATSSRWAACAPAARRTCPVPLNDGGRPVRRCGCSTGGRGRDHRAGSTPAKKTGDTLGGEVEVVARGVPVGLGSHVAWDRKLDGRLAGSAHVHSRGEGRGDRARLRGGAAPGSEVHDPIAAGAGARRDAGAASAGSATTRAGSKAA